MWGIKRVTFQKKEYWHDPQRYTPTSKTLTKKNSWFFYFLNSNKSEL